MRRCCSCLIVVIIIVAIGWLYLNQIYSAPQEAENYVSAEFVIEPGQGMSLIAENLQAQNLLHNTFHFKSYILLKQLQAKFKVGTYDLNNQMSVKEIATELTKDREPKQEIKVTILEGWNNAQIAQKISEQFDYSQDEVLKVMADPDNFDYSFLKDLPEDATLEGFLYPDTYLFYEDATIEEILIKFLDNFDVKLTPGLSEEITNQQKSVFEIVTLASIVEKEMFGYENRKIVAGIFQNRLADNYPLQSDATVNYITQKGTTRPSLEDTKLDNPYNTYQNAGLPPGPICNPSIEAIKAVIYAEPTEYYFFLTTQDNEIIFSRTHEEHILNRNKYLN